MNQLAICVPTYQQPEMLREMLIRCMDIYRKFNIDIYIYDSSPDRETDSVVEAYKAAYRNLYYRHLSADIYSNMKVLMAYKEIIRMGKYKYLWLCPDYIQLTEQGVECVLKHCRKEFDICVLNYRDVEHIGEKEYKDISAFFLDCAWHMSSYMATIICLSSFSDVDWEDIHRRYTTNGRICHSHVALYFEQLARLPEVRAVHVPISSVHMRVSSYRKDSLWKKEVFSVWCEAWPDVIHALPDKYRYKEAVIKKLGVNTGILGWENLAMLRKERIYDRHIYRKYPWKKLTNVPCGLLRILAVMPPEMAGMLKRKGLKRKLLERRLRRFCKGKEDIYIYGCGFIAQKTSSLLDRLHIRYCGYVVSDCSGEKTGFNSLPVMEYGELVSGKSDVAIIVALNKVNTAQIMLEEREVYKIFYMFRYEDVLAG